MKIPRLFIDQPLHVDQSVFLDRDASKYIVRVLRRTTGDQLLVFNGDGSDYPATITCAGKATEIQINRQQKNNTESPMDITLVQSLAKGTKLDLIIQKATELGVKRITPIASDRSVLQIDRARLAKRMDHWRGVAISACTQSQRSFVPVIDEPQSYINWLESASHENTFLLHPLSEHTIGSVNCSSQRCTVVIGPEGGFSSEELHKANLANIQSISCGPRILRTETAGFTVIAVFQSRFGDLK